MTTVWLTVLVSAERYVAICRPLHAATVCTASRVRLAVLAIAVASVLFNVPRYVEVEVAGSGSVIVKSPVGNAPAFRFVYTSAMYALALFLVPLGLLVYQHVPAEADHVRNVAEKSQLSAWKVPAEAE